MESDIHAMVCNANDFAVPLPAVRDGSDLRNRRFYRHGEPSAGERTFELDDSSCCWSVWGLRWTILGAVSIRSIRSVMSTDSLLSLGLAPLETKGITSSDRWLGG